ncbi:integrating conjugative element protein [Aggregatibacter actinomycetemcomitans]|uniref:integrating conjugative element protein n=1 Tax=Aggregatibacter actinomycetemcomitans TaxID=714 RepID=UPI00197C78A4|nr:integrating conjugative element protein [Aggregatibacter actinomycetemcomitans]MBN6058663.1 integrating conjugative element protein [Aggregatibacter actinomycetemcomitans]MBN6087172.1 integrating conjugative element protein [Aggregatibacter actinomycetemcomitans]
MKKTALILLLSLTLPILVHAELKVIADMGGESAVRFYEALQPDQSTVKAHPNAIPATLTESDILPVISHRLSPGHITPVSMNLTGIQPIFLIGADNTSAQWLQHNYQRLVTMHATGLVVNVKTVDELTILRRLAPELTILPTPGDDLAERLKLQHYPVLLTESGLSQ